MGKYQKLTEHLANRDHSEWTATFEDIERALGFPLPESARVYQAWWSNQMRSQSLSWQSVGWKTTALSLTAEQVTFVYVGPDYADKDIRDPDHAVGDAQRMTIADAKAGIAMTFGVDPSQIEITIKA